MGNILLASAWMVGLLVAQSSLAQLSINESPYIDDPHCTDAILELRFTPRKMEEERAARETRHSYTVALNERVLSIRYFDFISELPCSELNRVGEEPEKEEIESICVSFSEAAEERTEGLKQYEVRALEKTCITGYQDRSELSGFIKQYSEPADLEIEKRYYKPYRMCTAAVRKGYMPKRDSESLTYLLAQAWAVGYGQRQMCDPLLPKRS